ncbi:hypothetical protein [Mycoplasma sp. 4044]
MIWASIGLVVVLAIIGFLIGFFKRWLWSLITFVISAIIVFSIILVSDPIFNLVTTIEAFKKYKDYAEVAKPYIITIVALAVLLVIWLFSLIVFAIAFYFVRRKRILRCYSKGCEKKHIASKIVGGLLTMAITAPIGILGGSVVALANKNYEETWWDRLVIKPAIKAITLGKGESISSEIPVITKAIEYSTNTEKREELTKDLEQIANALEDIKSDANSSNESGNETKQTVPITPETINTVRTILNSDLALPVIKTIVNNPESDLGEKLEKVKFDKEAVDYLSNQENIEKAKKEFENMSLDLNLTDKEVSNLKEIVRTSFVNTDYQKVLESSPLEKQRFEDVLNNFANIFTNKTKQQ